MMFRLTVWNRRYEEVGTIERPTAGELLDMGKKLQEDYGAVYKVEYVGEARDEARRTEVGTGKREAEGRKEEIWPSSTSPRSV